MRPYLDMIVRMQHARALRARVMAEMAGAALAAIAAGYRRMRAAWRSRRLRDDLHRQGDYLLRDIGVRRSRTDALFR